MPQEFNLRVNEILLRYRGYWVQSSILFEVQVSAVCESDFHGALGPLGV